MNIFILDEDNDLNARYYVDKHIVKIPLEIAQILCSVHHICGEKSDSIPYRLTHKNHPICVWARQSLSNYIWICRIGLSICKEYTYRYGKRHKSELVINWCLENLPKVNDIGLMQFVQAMPDEYKNPDPIKAYRSYYMGEKRHLFSWKKREVPLWITREKIDEMDCTK